MDVSTTNAVTVTQPPNLAARFLEPKGFRWGIFTGVAGEGLRCGRLDLPNPVAECILVGGFAEFIEKYFETINDLAARRIAVRCLDWRGQGGSARAARTPRRAGARDFDQDVADLAAFADETPRGSRPRILIAHSMGAGIALACAHDHPDLFDGVVLSAPMLGLNLHDVPEWLARLFAATMCTIGFSGRFVPGARAWVDDPTLSPQTSLNSSDPERCLLQSAWFRAKPDLRLDGATFAWLRTALRFCRRFAAADYFAAIRTPVLLGSAGLEVLVDPQSHLRAAAHLPQCQMVEYPQSKHELFMELDAVRLPWFAAIDRFIGGIVTR